MKKLLSFLLLFLTISFPVSASQEETGLVFMKHISDNIMKEVVRSEGTLPEKQEKFREIFLKIINTKKAIPYTLGLYARSVTPEQMSAYSQALIDNIIYTWTARFCAYKDAQIIFESERKNQNNDTFVISSIHFPQSESDIEVVWRLTEKNQEFKLADIVVEGISMLFSYRGEYTSFLQQNNGDISKLIKSLEAKNATLKKAPVQG